jgi:drug/metabolite transporter (DMT)-like permease
LPDQTPDKSSINTPLKTLLLTSLALIAFAANSVLCRLALGEGAIDAAGFTIVRMVSAVLVLFILVTVMKNVNRKASSSSSSSSSMLVSKGSWTASIMLFVYAVAFSFAYQSLGTGTGALILFGAVQITMLVVSVVTGTRLRLLEWVGIAGAFSGFVYLVLPQVSTPSLTGFILMALSGVAWGFYSVLGRNSKNPLMDTHYNFLRSLVFVLVLLVFSFQGLHTTFNGVLYAVLSGGIMSALGYTFWYMALKRLAATHAAVVQLLVPVVAAIGGVIFVSEDITMRLMISGAMILGGILLVVLAKPKLATDKTVQSD